MTTEIGEQRITVSMRATVRIYIRQDTDAVTRVTGASGDEWRRGLYQLYSEDDVLDMWADNCIRNGVGDVSELDGWADIPEGTITMCVLQTQDFERQP